MFEFLQHKTKKQYFEEETDLEFGLVFDEIGITPMESYVASIGSYLGKVTFPNDKSIASRMMVSCLVS